MSPGAIPQFFRQLLGHIWLVEARLRGVECGEGVRFIGRPILTRHPNSVIKIGARTVITSSPRCSSLGHSKPCVLRTMAESAILEIGEDCGLSGASVVAAKSVKIGPGTLFGSDSILMDTDFHARDDNRHWITDYTARVAPVSIGEDCFIGTRAILLKGVTLGAGSTVAAGAVLPRGNYPPGSVLAGNPARVVTAGTPSPQSTRMG